LTDEAKARRRARRGRVVYAILRVAGAIVRPMPLRLVRACGVALGHLAWHVAGRDRRRALENIAIAFPQWSAAQRRSTIRAMFHHLGKSVFEILWLPNLTPANRAATTRYTGFDRTVEQMRAGRSVVVITAHCGNWEWLACGVGVGAEGLPVAVLQRERNEADINRYITELRAQAGVHTIDRGSAGSARELIQATRRGGILAFLIDQNLRAESAKVPFFGKPALTPIGPAKLAIRTKSLIVTGFVERLPDGMQHIRFDEPFPAEGDPIELTARLTRAIEAQIRSRPEQWVWFHDRWRERPQWDVAYDAARPSS
jgi:Kdo2-lipid IVA lauroyltransferase/acyltransferase